MSNSRQSEQKSDTPTDSTPGRPRDTSRQQNHDEQNLQSGSESLDRRSAGDSGAKGPKPPGPK
jgi:hypothetical protein